MSENARNFDAYDDVFAMDEAQETTIPAEGAQTPTPDPIDAPAPTDTAQPTDAPTTPEQTTPPAGYVSQADMGAAMAAIRRDYEAKLAQVQQQPQQPAAPAPEPELEEAPDPYDDPQGFADYVQRRASDEINAFRATIENERREERYQATLAAQGPAFDSVVDAAWQTLMSFSEETRSRLTAEIKSSPDPVARIRQLAGGNAAPAPLTPEAILADPALAQGVRDRVLQEEAARRAQAAQPPQAPRGVGAGPAGAGAPSGRPAASEFKRIANNDPNAWERLKESVFDS